MAAVSLLQIKMSVFFVILRVRRTESCSRITASIAWQRVSNAVKRPVNLVPAVVRQTGK
jgi:hypothetical protein